MTPTYTVVRGGTPGGEGTWTLYSVDPSKYNAADKPTINLTNGFLVGTPMNVLKPLGLVCDPCAGTDPGLSPAKNFPEPRVGFAYDLFGDGKMAVRGGFAIFNERLRQNNFNFGAGGQWPDLSSQSLVNGNVSSISTTGLGGSSAAISPPSMSVWSANNTMPTIYAWHLGVQRELPGRFTLDLSYSGNHAIHLMDQRQLNYLPAGTYLANPNLLQSVNYFSNALMPYLGWGNLNAIETQAYSRYDAMMFRLSRRFAQNLSVNLNYTWSKVMDIVDNDSDSINNPACIRCNWANAGYNQPNVATLDFVYMLPKVKGSLDVPFLRQALDGWEISSMIRGQSGMPVNITSNGNLMGINAGNQYPNLIGDPYAGQDTTQWLNQAAFARPADGTYGDLGRNALHLPAIFNVDASLMKNFAISERAKLTFRCEVFNLLNHPQVWGLANSFSGDNPGSLLSASDANFGQANSWRDQRILQLALRFAFYRIYPHFGQTIARRSSAPRLPLPPPLRSACLRLLLMAAAFCEAVERIVGAHIDPSVENRRRGKDIFAKAIDSEHLPLRARKQHHHFPVFACQQDLAVGRHGRRPITAQCPR